MSVAEIAKRIKREPAEIIKKLFMMGVMVTQNQSLDGDTIELLFVSYASEPKRRLKWTVLTFSVSLSHKSFLNENEMIERPPVVTIMGHVDHR